MRRWRLERHDALLLAVFVHREVVARQVGDRMARFICDHNIEHDQSGVDGKRSRARWSVLLLGTDCGPRQTREGHPRCKPVELASYEDAALHAVWRQVRHP